MKHTRAARMRLTVLGCRGSVSVSGTEFDEFGGGTSCYLVEADGESLFLDAGTGLLKAPTSFARPACILLSHPHLDHLSGLGAYGPLFASSLQLRLLVPAQSDVAAKRMIDNLYSPPLWPVTLTDCKGLSVEALPEVLSIGGLDVCSIEGSHPGGCRVFKIGYADKSLVYASDYEYSESSFERLVRFCKAASLVLFDAQYREDEYETRRGYGHSTARVGLELMRRSGAERMLLIHHDPRSSDAMLRARERELGDSRVRYAREGEVVDL
ncbi:MAG: MBL fold metallo-hydrolase [Coriobacteriales bacterium]|nr:MBL fold metallo-hydrolase [Coriobacteriales bacterium]